MKTRINFKQIYLNFLQFRNDNLVYIFSITIPIFVMIGLYIIRGIFPFGNSAYLVRDMYHQYAPFFVEFANKIKSGESLTYSSNIGMGINFTALYAYYLASPTNWLLALLPTSLMIEIMNIFIIGKIGLCGLSFSYYINKHFKQKDIRVAVFALFYALSSYMAAYSWNIMWLDCLVLLPLIILGLELLMQNSSGKYGLLYCISLGVAIFSNYYIGIMLCIFSVLYFLYLLITTEPLHGVAAYLKKMWHFGLYSLIAGGLSACLLLPEYFALKMSGSSDMNFPDSLERYFSIFEMLSRFMMNVPVSTGLTHEPNIYSSVIILLLIPLYLFNSGIRKREKIGKMVLIFLFLFSFSYNIPDFIWHGFHFPNSLPARQSFIFVFLLLEMSYEAFRGIRLYSYKQLYGSFAGTLLLFILFDHFLADENLDYGIIYLSMIIVAFYVLIFALYRNNFENEKRKLIALLLFFLLAITEVTINTGSTGVDIVNRTSYLSDNRAISKLIDQVKEEDTDYYRIEKIVRRTKNDAAWSNYPGASIFSSTTNAHLNDFLDSLGFQSSTNAYSFSGYTPLTASLLSVKYLLSSGLIDSTPLVELYSQTDGQYLYHNYFTLPLGFMMDSAIEEHWKNDSANPFTVQNSFANAVLQTANLNTADLGIEGELFEEIDCDISGKIATIPVTTTDSIYIYTNTNDLESLDVTFLSPDGETAITKTITDLRHKYIVGLGATDPGTTITITTPDEVDSIYMHAYRHQTEIFQAVYQQLTKQPFIIESFEETKIKGSIDVTKSGIMYTSIPFEEGWTAVIDGEPTKTVKFKDALLAIPMSEGSHSVELTYTPQGLPLGILISATSLLLLIGVVVYYRKKKEPLIEQVDDTNITNHSVSSDTL